jgi:hypothetical protein
VEVYVGPSDGPGEESFCLTVCTPAALVEVLADQPVLVGRHWLFVAEFSPRVVEEFLRRRIGEVEGGDLERGGAAGRAAGVAGVRGLPARERLTGQVTGLGRAASLVNAVSRSLAQGQFPAMRSRVRRPPRVIRAATRSSQ